MARTPRFTSNSESVWLTFDDGPTPDLTVPILELLARYGVKATFFVRGAAALRYPEIIRRMVTEGHGVANHSMTHRDLTTLTFTDIERELAHTSDVIAGRALQSALFDELLDVAG